MDEKRTEPRSKSRKTGDLNSTVNDPGVIDDDNDSVVRRFCQPARLLKGNVAIHESILIALHRNQS